MDIKEALRIMRLVTQENESGRAWEGQEEAAKVAIEALEKQIPSPVYLLDDGTFETSCCGYDVTDEDHEYCPHCGSRLGGAI